MFFTDPFIVYDFADAEKIENLRIEGLTGIFVFDVLLLQNNNLAAFASPAKAGRRQ